MCRNAIGFVAQRNGLRCPTQWASLPNEGTYVLGEYKSVQVPAFIL